MGRQVSGGLPALRAAALAGLLAFSGEAHALSDSLPVYEAEEEIEAAPPSGAPPTDVTRPDTSLDAVTPEVLYNLDRLPEPVRRMRALIIEACRSGDIERLRPLLGSGDDATQISFGMPEGDPIQYLREVSGDEQGQEILAILLEVMEAGFVHMDPGTDHALYVWPYFFALPLEELTPQQRVELFTIITAGDYEEMKNFGAYVFYRSAITPEGRWVFFVAGD